MVVVDGFGGGPKGALVVTAGFASDVGGSWEVAAGRR